MIVAGCSAPPPSPPPAPQPQAQTAPTPAVPPKPVLQQPSGPWLDWPIAEGSWVYRQDNRGSIALFGLPGKDALVTLRCDTARRQIFFARADESLAGASSFTIRSHSMMKTFSAGNTGGNPPYVAAAIAPGDTILDAVAYTRGRIAIEVTGQQSIAIPIWSEVPRVIEDCR